MFASAYWLSFAAVLLTKLADALTTLRHVDPRGELNPLARSWFIRLGMSRGVWCLTLLVVVLTSVVFFVTWITGPAWARWVVLIQGTVISLAQADVARFNVTRRHSWFTRRVMSAYGSWGRWR